MKHQEAKILNSFSVHGRGILIELNHGREGLIKGTLLTSQPSNLKWEVFSRVLFNHAGSQQKVFPKEEIQYMLLHFGERRET